MPKTKLAEIGRSDPFACRGTQTTAYFHGLSVMTRLYIYICYSLTLAMFTEFTHMFVRTYSRTRLFATILSIVCVSIYGLKVL